MPSSENYQNIIKREKCTLIKGNQVEFEIKKDDCEIRADIVVKELHCVRIWGQVKDCEGKPVEDALIKLAKVIRKDGEVKLVGIAHTITDCKGFYQFDVCERKEHENCDDWKYEKDIYRVIASMAAMGNDRTIHESECEPCREKGDYYLDVKASQII